MPDFPKLVCTQVELPKLGVLITPLGVTTVLRGTSVKRGLSTKSPGRVQESKKHLKGRFRLRGGGRLTLLWVRRSEAD